jgi:magnesium-transporting ATPase (P-type)
MLILVRVNDEVYLFVKGAESSIWPHLNSFNDVDIKMTIEQHSLDFAQQEYRILFCTIFPLH